MLSPSLLPARLLGQRLLRTHGHATYLISMSQNKLDGRPFCRSDLVREFSSKPKQRQLPRLKLLGNNDKAAATQKMTGDVPSDVLYEYDRNVHTCLSDKSLIGCCDRGTSRWFRRRRSCKSLSGLGSRGRKLQFHVRPDYTSISCVYWSCSCSSSIGRCHGSVFSLGHHERCMVFHWFRIQCHDGGCRRFLFQGICPFLLFLHEYAPI